MKTLAAGIVAAVIVTSCSVEKRHYTSGYSVQWNSKKSNVSVTEASYVAKQTPKTENKKATENKTIIAQAPVEQVAVNSKTVNKTLVASVNKTVYTKTTAKVTSFENTIASNNAKIVEKVAAPAKAPVKGEGADIPVWAYILLAIFIPFVAVGLATDWSISVLWNILWSLLCGIPGIIHAFIILKRTGHL